MTPQQLGEQPAFPQHGWSSDPKTIARMQEKQGLTKREEFAKAAMASMDLSAVALSSIPALSKATGRDAQWRQEMIDAIAKSASDLADALLIELAKPTCTCGEPHNSDRIQHCYDGSPCHVKENP